MNCSQRTLHVGRANYCPDYSLFYNWHHPNKDNDRVLQTFIIQQGKLGFLQAKLKQARMSTTSPTVMAVLRETHRNTFILM